MRDPSLPKEKDKELKKKLKKRAVRKVKKKRSQMEESIKKHRSIWVVLGPGGRKNLQEQISNKNSNYPMT